MLRHRSFARPLALGRHMPYLAGMAIFPQPVSPKRALIDLRDYLMEGRRHKILFLLLAIAATWVIVWGFLIDSKTNTARSEEHTSELQSLMRISYSVFCLIQKIKKTTTQ